MKAYKAGELLELSMEFEKNARELYKKWTVKFAGVPNVAAFWSEYSADENFHYNLLDQLRARLSPDQLDGPIESDLVGDTRRLLAYLQKEHNIEDLEQAFQYANMIEHSEVNPLFEVIMSHFEPDQEAITLLQSQLNEHIDKLIYKFPARFSRPEQRQAIKVQP